MFRNFCMFFLLVTDASGNGFYWGNRLEMNLWSKRIIIYIYHKLSCIYNRENHPICVEVVSFQREHGVFWDVFSMAKSLAFPGCHMALSGGPQWDGPWDLLQGTGHGLPSQGHRRWMGNPLEMELFVWGNHGKVIYKTRNCPLIPLPSCGEGAELSMSVSISYHFPWLSTSKPIFSYVPSLSIIHDYPTSVFQNYSQWWIEGAIQSFFRLFSY